MRHQKEAVMKTIKWILPLLFLAATGVPAQEEEQPAIRQFYAADGSPLYKLWFLLNRVDFRYRGEGDAMKRLDVNQEEETTVYYDEEGQRKPLKIMVRLSLENGPPVSTSISKEHEIRRLRIWMDVYEGDEEVESVDRKADDFVVARKKDSFVTMEPFTFRGVTLTPNVHYYPLQDLAGDAYFVKMEGIWFMLEYPL